MGAMAEAALTFQSKQQSWARLVQNAMACDFSWDRSARQYEDLYRRAVERRRGE
jgi:glycogen synthase